MVRHEGLVMILDNAAIVAGQVLILFLLIGVGFVVRKIRMLDDSSLRQVNTLLLVIINPCIILSSFQSTFDRRLLYGILIAAVSAVVTHALGAVLARLVFRKSPPAHAGVLQFSTIFSNCAFMCIPLLNALLGSEGVLYGSVYIAIFNTASWTYGVLLMTGSGKDINLRKALVNPGTVSILVALPLFLLQIKLPEIPLIVIDYLAVMNTPLAMILIGAQMATIPFLSMFRGRSIYTSALLRLIVIPGLILIPLSFIDIDRTVLLACMIPAMAPTAAASALFATRYEQDFALATRSVAFSTLLSILTMPLMIVLSSYINGF